MSVRQGNNIIAISNVAIDGQTISANSNNSLQSLGTVNKNQASGALGNVFDWVGTLSDYTTQDIENTHPEWICYITDDGATVDGIYSSAQCDDLFARIADVYTRSQANDLFDTKANSNNVYTKAEIDTMQSGKANIDANNFTTTGTTTLSRMALPSTRVDDLTVLASNATYTAPANGWFQAIGTAPAQGNVYIILVTDNGTVRERRELTRTSSFAGKCGVCIPAVKDQEVLFGYSMDDVALRFFYAEGNPGGQ